MKQLRGASARIVMTALPTLLITGTILMGNTPVRAQLFQAAAKKPLPAEAPLAPFAWKDVSGAAYDQTTLTKNRATVFLFSSTQCPIANIYTPRMIELAKDYGKRGVQLFLVNSNQEETQDTVRRYAKERKFPFPAVKDEKLALADLLNANHTPEAVIVDGKGIVRYRGRIDDNADRQKVVRHDVREALDAILAGKPVAIGRTLPFGCAIFRDTVKPVATKLAKVTYTRDIAPILFQNCLPCHRAGEAAPFELKTYQQAKTWAAAIKDYTARRVMPPWKAVPGIGDFHDARSLSDEQIARIAQWADAGAPQGDLKELPKLPDFPKDGGQLGAPKDGGIFRSAEAYELGPEGKDVYRQFILPVDTTKDRYINAMEFLPDNRAIVHHMIIFYDLSGKSVELDKVDPGPGYSVENGGGGIGVPFDKAVWVAGWAPGNTARFLPAGLAFRQPKGAKVVLQVHYHRNGKTEFDRSSVAFHYVDESKVEKVVYTGMVLNPSLNLKPGEAQQKVTANRVLPQDTEVIAVSPHMHMLGREMKLTANLPDGTQKPLIYINDWDFNWQETYRYKEPIRLPKGTRIDLLAYFDNSEKNPRQPSHPPVPVSWGEQTTDEMCIGFYLFTVDRKSLKGEHTLLGNTSG
jgi:hypothetical protein